MTNEIKMETRQLTFKGTCSPDLRPLSWSDWERSVLITPQAYELVYIAEINHEVGKVWQMTGVKVLGTSPAHMGPIVLRWSDRVPETRTFGEEPLDDAPDWLKAEADAHRPVWDLP